MRGAAAAILAALLLASSAGAGDREKPRKRQPKEDIPGYTFGNDGTPDACYAGYGPRPVSDKRDDDDRPSQAKPLYYYGDVKLSDRGAPYEPILLERICEGGTPIAAGSTDLLGRFTVESPPGCVLQASLPGFRSDAPSLFANRDVGTLMLERLPGVQGLTISETSTHAPPEAQRALLRGARADADGKPADARRQYRRAVELFPRYAAVWHRLGALLQADGKREAARQAFHESLETDGSLLPPLHALYVMATDDRDWAEVVTLTERSIVLGPVDAGRASYYAARAYLELQRFDFAETRAREAIALGWDRQEPRAKLLLDEILLRRVSVGGLDIE